MPVAQGQTIHHKTDYDRPLVTGAKPTPKSEQLAAELGVGRWIWTTNFADQQTCRLWHEFTISDKQGHPHKANLRITADDYYVCYLDGREIGRGGNWENLTDYDFTWLLAPGKHVLAVEAVNDIYEGGVLLGFRMQFAQGEPMLMVSDTSWRIVPNDAGKNWLTQTSPDKNWIAAKEIGVIGQSPWWEHPATVTAPTPLAPIQRRFWQTGWFIALMLSVLGAVLVLSLVLATKVTMQSRARRMLAQERSRIARDMHDDLGSTLTQLVLQTEVAQMEVNDVSAVRTRLKHLSERARNASQTLDEVIWTVNSQRDTLGDLTSYLCKYAQNYLKATPIRCRLDVQPDLPATFFDLPVRRGLLLGVKEALNNAVKYSNATELFLRIHQQGDRMVIVVEDNGRGFDPASTSGDRHGISNQQQRMRELGGAFRIISQPDKGCRAEFAIPLTLSTKFSGFSWPLRFWLKFAANPLAAVQKSSANSNKSQHQAP